MDGDDDNLYDDTMAEDEETERKVVYQSNEQADDNVATGSTVASDRRKPPQIGPRPTSVLRQSTGDGIAARQDMIGEAGTGSSSAPTVTQTPPGYYYFDGTQWSSLPRQENIYAPGSDYCHVTKAKDSDDDNDDDNSTDSESDSSGRADSNDDVQVCSKLSGMRTLNINIRLNVADLVRSSTTAKRHRKKRTRHKTVHRSRQSNYDNHDLSEHQPTESNREPTENSMKSVQKGVYEDRPARPPKLFQLINSSKENSTADAQEINKENPTTEEPNAGYENMSSIATFEAAMRERNIKRHMSEPAFGSNEETYGVYNRDDLYTKISGVDESDRPIYLVSDFDVYDSDVQIKAEVEKLAEAYDWFFIYKERQKADIVLSDSQSPDGSFAVISENIEENFHFPFTLLLKYRGNVTRTPIKRIVEFKKKKYELFNTRKDTIIKLVEHFQRKPLPHFKICLNILSWKRQQRWSQP